jgi:dimethylglycine dehydrogenase
VLDGCVGSGILYGLAKRGWTDCLLLEKSRLSSGSTWMAGGVIRSYIHSNTLSRLINKSIEIYKGLEPETGQSVSWDNCGKMRLARSTGRLDEYPSDMDTIDSIGQMQKSFYPKKFCNFGHY